MIYYLYCGLIMSGYAACSTLLGGFMMQYAGAREIDLGFIFMLQPLCIFFRPFICAHADRRQIHRQMLAFYATLTGLSYLPFIIYPFFHGMLTMENYQQQQQAHDSTASNELEAVLDEIMPDQGLIQPDMARLFIHETKQRYQRLIFWSLMGFHLIGSIGFCGVRSLGDALAVNYAKRIGTDFARFRKYGSLSYGFCNFGLGFINQDWLVPNFVPALSVYTGSMLFLALLVFAWPREYFEMSCQDNENEEAKRQYLARLPTSGESLRQVLARVCSCGASSGPRRSSSSIEYNPYESCKAPPTHNKWPGQDKMHNCHNANTDPRKQICPQTQAGTSQLSVGQQLRIFGLLLKRDFRISLYLLIILYGGLTGYSGPNFVFTYINLVCSQRGTCKASELCGLVMLSYCFVETAVYMIIDRWGHRFNRTMMLELTFLVLTFHYLFYGLALDHLSPYFFLVESLHGIEYGISLTASVNLGYYFAREVELLLPELSRKGIVGPHDNIELVKVSLMATMSGCYTLAYDGIGCILGCLAFGLVLGNFGFNVMWISIGVAACAGLLVIGIGYTLGKCFGIRPEILRIRDQLLEAPDRRPISGTSPKVEPASA